MDDNEIQIEGKIYVAVACDSCNGCAFDDDEWDGPLCLSVKCEESARADERSVIFVEKQE